MRWLPRRARDPNNRGSSGAFAAAPLQAIRRSLMLHDSSAGVRPQKKRLPLRA
jgi:hypothetical protein